MRAHSQVSSLLAECGQPVGKTLDYRQLLQVESPTVMDWREYEVKLQSLSQLAERLEFLDRTVPISLWIYRGRMRQLLESKCKLTEAIRMLQIKALAHKEGTLRRWASP